MLTISWGYLAPQLPQLGVSGGLAVSLLVGLPLFTFLVAALSPLRGMGVRALLVALLAAALAAPLTYLHVVPLANVAKVVAAAGLGYWLVGALTSPAVVVLIAGLSSLVDIVSVAVGPTRALLEKAPAAVGYLTVAFAWPGLDLATAHTALGVSDFVFFSLYVGAARAFGLRPAVTSVAVALGIATAVIAGIWVGAMPALPFLALGFLAANADLLFTRQPPRPRVTAPLRRG